MKKKPIKKPSRVLFELIEQAILSGRYYFTEHGEMRSKGRRNVTDEEVLRILTGTGKWHEAAKDKYDVSKNDWNYHIRGKNTDGENVRIAISFDEWGMAIKTVINLDED